MEKCKVKQNKIVFSSTGLAEIKKIYDDFLGKPLGEKSHELLHTKYEAKDEYSND